MRFAEQGILSVGIPLFQNNATPFAALALSGPWPADETPDVVKLLRETADAILGDLSLAHDEAVRNGRT